MVSNLFPFVETDRRLAIIGEAPCEADEKCGEPFMGAPGNLLSAALANANSMRSACFLGNVCQHQPINNKIENFDWTGSEIQGGLDRLRQDLFRWRPNAVLLLGNTAITAAGIHHKITEFRGTIFECTHVGSPFFGLKCIASLAPGAVLRNWESAPLFSFDVARAVSEAEFSDTKLPIRTYDVHLSPEEVIRKLEEIPKHQLISFDIEGGVTQGITCISISLDPSYAFIIPLDRYDDGVKARVMMEFNRIMASEEYPKLLQNGLYDTFVLAWLYKLPVRNMKHDTMLSSWEIYPELPKGLGVQASIWTKQPFYKFERKIDDQVTHYKYCCTDAAVTLELHQAQMKHFESAPWAKKHYEFNMSLLPTLQYMQLRGIKYDSEGVKEHLKRLKSQMSEVAAQAEVNAGQAINMNSPKQMCDLLYRKLGLEPQYKMLNGRKTNSLTADKEAMLKLAVKFGHPFLLTALNWRKLDGVRKQLEVEVCHDGRMRCSYNLVGAETGRLSCSASLAGFGTNLQTIMKQLRKYYVADDDKYFFQCDLSGADGWTVAVHAYELGDPTMLDDYLAGIKPAKVIAVMHLLGAQISNLSRAELKDLIKRTEIPDSLYAVCKAVQHGSNYLMGPNTMSSNVLKKSFAEAGDLVYVPPRDCKVLQALYFRRYPGVDRWHNETHQKLKRTGTLNSASGHVRTFFGRLHDRETLKAALAHEPQHNTTYVTNLAMWNLWHDKSNRDSTGSIKIEPLHSVHDALCGQFDRASADENADKIANYFRNPIKVGNYEFTIPFEGGYGPNWYETDEQHRVGEIKL